MSEALSQDPESLGSGGYTTLTSSYPPTPATPSSTVQDVPPGSNLPPFSTFSSEMDAAGAAGFHTERLFSDTRLLDISSWDYYQQEARLLERSENGLSIIASQPQYRPWESKPIDSSSQDSLRHTFSTTTPVSTFAEAFAAQNGVPKLPSFQSQFQSFNEPVTTSEPTLTTLTNLTPVSPNPSSPGSHSLTTLNSNFHTLSTVNPRNYPLVPAPIQAREIPSIQQQFLDERHIQLYSHPNTNLATLNTAIHTTGMIFPPQNGNIIQNSQLISSPTVVTVLKSEPDIKLTTLQDPTLKIQNVGLHPTQFQNPMSAMMDNNIYNGLDKKINGIGGAMGSPTRNDFRKKEKRKMRTSSLESSAESDGASSNMEIGSENSGQVAAVSSTAGFKSHHSLAINSSVDADEISGGNVDKQVKKKRKRCGECIGCQRKDNCGDCAPCRNDKSHQICKQRRCEKLTEKKNLYGDAGYLRGESRRGRGKGRGSGSYRGRKPSGPVTPIAGANTGPVQVTTAPEPGAATAQPPSRPSPQPASTVHMLKPEQPVQQQPMATMPFYADPNRFTTPVWQADPTQGWPQGQFVQQIPAPGQPTLEGYPQQYPNGIYQSYQQPFETNTFYTGAVQVLSSTRPPSATNQVPLGTRTNGSYSHTPSPAPPQTPTGNTQRQQYHQEFSPNTQNYIAPATTPTGGGNMDNSQQGGVSRPSSVNSTVNVPTSNQNFSQQNGSSFTSVSSTNFSPNSNTNSSFVNSNMGTNSGNAQPGYPQVISSPQLVSHNSSGYPGNNEYSGNNQFHLQQQQQQQQIQLQQQNWQNSIPQQSDDQIKMMWDQQREQIKDDQNGHNMYPIQNIKTEDTPKNTTQFTQDDRINLNTKLKTMILNKQQNLENKAEQSQKVDPNNSTGHFLWYSHHRRHQNTLDDGGGVPHPTINRLNEQNHFKSPNSMPRQQFKSPVKDVRKLDWIKKESPIKTEFNKNEVLLNGTIDKKFVYPQFQRNGEVKLRERFAYEQFNFKSPPSKHHDEENFKQNVGSEIPVCSCFPPDQFPPEPGSYYTHLGCSDSLDNLRKDLEFRVGVNGKALRIEKVCYTGKEGKTSQGCPIAKWIIRRSGLEEKYLIVVKHRRGHFCQSAFIVICIVAWEGVEKGNADDLYSLLTHKLNKFGVPTTRRCATNEPRTCACQGLDPEKCGASFSFGCSWSMYYNGCKYARSKTVRKFRLTVQNEETDVEEKMQNLANHLSPLYKTVAPNSFNNQCEYEKDASDCRLGFIKGRPFSGVTACMDFCAHAHKDSHNMNNGCTVVVTLTKHRTMDKAEDEQLHVLPLYVVDETDEFGSKESQQEKIRNGSIEILNKYQCEVRVRTVPLTPCRRTKKRKDEELQKMSPAKKDNGLPHYNSPTSIKSTISSPVSPRCTTPQYVQNKSQLQSSHVSSTVLDSPESPQWRYDTNNYYYSNGYNQTSPLPKFSEQFCRSDNRFTVLQKSQTNTAFNNTAPYFNPQINHCESVPRDYFSYDNISSYNFHHHHKANDYYYNGIKANPWQSPIPDYTPYGSFGENYSAGFSNHASYRVSNPFDDFDDAGYGRKLFQNWSQVLPSSYSAPIVPNYQLPVTKPKVELLGEVTDYVDNVECFKDSSIGGVAIALAHGSVLFECAKHELHATTALKQPNRQSPTRISLVFYQHRNMNRAKHGWDEWEEKTKLRKMGIDIGSTKIESSSAVELEKKLDCTEVMLRAPTLTTISLTTLFPMYPCVVTGPYQDAAGAVRTFG